MKPDRGPPAARFWQVRQMLRVVTAAIVCATAPTVLADDGTVPLETQPRGLHWIDWGLIVLYAVSTIGLGVYFSRKQRSTREYFLGTGNMNSLLIGVSLFASTLSTISYLGVPGEVMGKGPMNLTSLLMYPVTFFVVGYFLLPVYMRHRVTSAYELLEDRLGLGARLLAASVFLLTRLVWMAMMVYLASKAMVWMMGVDPQWIPLIAAVTGVVSVVYTSLGGMRAVVITDLMQTLLLYGGALLVLIMVTWDYGGFGWLPTTWQSHWDTQPIFSFDPGVRITVVGVMLSGFVSSVAAAGADQISIQRFMATRDAAAARRAQAAHLIVGAVVVLTLVLVGFALMSYFQTHADQLPANLSFEQNADELYPRFIAFHLPVGVSGLVVAAMFAAAMSSIDSGVNSITAVVMTDFLDRFGLGPKTERGHVRAAQFLALLIGVVVVLSSNYIRFIEGNIAEVTGKAPSSLLPSVFALFILALFVPFVRPAGALIGCFCGCTSGLAIAFSGPLVALLWRWFGVDPVVFGTEFITRVDPISGQEWTTVDDPISFQWVGISALLVALAVGVSLSWVQSRWERPSDQQTDRG